MILDRDGVLAPAAERVWVCPSATEPAALPDTPVPQEGRAQTSPPVLRRAGSEQLGEERACHVTAG